jgi:hypothetical protein
VPPATTNTAPRGFLDTVTSAGIVGGWAGDEDHGAVPVQVVVTVDGADAATVTTSLARPDVTTMFPTLTAPTGFRVTVPNQYRDGRRHTVAAFAIDDDGARVALNTVVDLAVTFDLVTTPTPTPTPPPPPPPAGSTVVLPSGQPIPQLAARTWYEIPWAVPTWTNDCNNAGDSQSIWNVAVCKSYPLAKHERMFYRSASKEMVIAGGDHPVSMPHPAYYDGTGSEVVAVNNSTGKWRVVRPFCVPGKVQPDRPDNVVWVYDSKRDRGIMTPGYYGVGWVGSGCGEIGGYGAYALPFATPNWVGPDAVAGLLPPPDAGWGGDRGSSYGVYSPTTDELVRLRQDGGGRVEMFSFTTNTWRYWPIDSVQPARTQQVIDSADPAGPTLYWIDAWQDAVMNAENTQLTNLGRKAYLSKMNLRTGVLVRIPMPAGWKGQEGLATDIYLGFDPINRVVLIPNNFDMGSSPLWGLGIYKVDAGTWEWESVPASAYGSAWAVDESLGCLVGVGKRQPPYGTFLYCYSGSK